MKMYYYLRDDETYIISLEPIHSSLYDLVQEGTEINLGNTDIEDVIMPSNLSFRFRNNTIRDAELEGEWE